MHLTIDGAMTKSKKETRNVTERESEGKQEDKKQENVKITGL